MARKTARKAGSRRKAARPKARAKSRPKRAAARPRPAPAMPARGSGVPGEKIKLLVGTGTAAPPEPVRVEPGSGRGERSDRCAECGASFQGFFARLFGPRRSATNPRLCTRCEKRKRA